MRISGCWLLLFAACTGTTQGAAAVPTVPLSCPVCPEPVCQETVCPAKPCPACPGVAPALVPADWHCFEVRLEDGDMGLCNASAKGCEDIREFTKTKKAGDPSPCTTRPTAFCFEVTYDNSWHRRCTPTSEGCEKAREVYRKNPLPGRRKLGTCQLARNIDPLDALNARTAASEP